MMDVASFNNVIRSLGRYTDLEHKDKGKFMAVPRSDNKVALITFDEQGNIGTLLAARNIDQLLLALYNKTIINVGGKTYKTLVEALGIVDSKPYLNRSFLVEQVLDIDSLELFLDTIVWSIKNRK